MSENQLISRLMHFSVRASPHQIPRRRRLPPPLRQDQARDRRLQSGQGVHGPTVID